MSLTIRIFLTALFALALNTPLDAPDMAEANHTPTVQQDTGSAAMALRRLSERY